MFVEVMRKSLRDGDVFARYGGEEFIALFVATRLKNIVATAERVRSAFAQAYVNAGNREVQTTVSIGISLFSQEDIDLETVIQRADEALYEAKKSGRNRYVVHDRDANLSESTASLRNAQPAN